MASENKDLARPDGPGSHASHEAGEPSSPSVSIPRAGQWAILKGWSGHRTRQIAKTTPKLIKFTGTTWPRQADKREVVAACDDEQTAKQLCQSLDGVWGEFERKAREMRRQHDERLAVYREKAERTSARIVASTIEARSDETPQAAQPGGRERDPKGDANNSSPPPPSDMTSDTPATDLRERIARAIASGFNLDPDAISPKAAQRGHEIPEWMFFMAAANAALAEISPEIERLRVVNAELASALQILADKWASDAWTTDQDEMANIARNALARTGEL